MGNLLIYLTLLVQVSLDQHSDSVSLSSAFLYSCAGFIFRVTLCVVIKSLPAANGFPLTSREIVRILFSDCDGASIGY